MGFVERLPFIAGGGFAVLALVGLLARRHSSG